MHPLDPGPEPAGRTVTACDGVDYHVIEYTGPAGSPKPVAVFLHGGGPGCSSWTDFGSVAPMFATGRRCVLVDLVQYGKSSKPIIKGQIGRASCRERVCLAV